LFVGFYRFAYAPYFVNYVSIKIGAVRGGRDKGRFPYSFLQKKNISTNSPKNGHFTLNIFLKSLNRLF
jgi:hypothetical protein